MRLSLSRGGATLTLAGALAACHPVGPDYRPPTPTAAEAPLGHFREGGKPPYTAGEVPGEWWHLYETPALNALIQRALSRNTTLQEASATLMQTQATLAEARAARDPTTSLSLSPVWAQTSADSIGAAKALNPNGLYSGLFSLSYDFDLFGKLRRGIEAANADVGAAQAALDLARVNIAGQTALAYAQVCASGMRLAVQQRAMGIAQDNVDVAQRRFSAGVAGENDVIRARTLFQQTSAQRPALLAAQDAGVYQLAALTGDSPDVLPPTVTECNTLPKINRPIPIGDGTALLRRRPDIRAAERSLAADVARIGQTTAQLYPSVTLGGSLGTLAGNITDITNTRGFRWSMGPLMTWDFPNTRITQAQIAIASATAAGRLAHFDGTVLTALRETETSLSDLAHQMDTVTELRAARNDASQAAANIRKTYQGGVTNFIDVLDAERTLIDADSQLAQAQAAVTNDQIRLFMALGGGWENAPAAPPPSLQRAEQPKAEPAKDEAPKK